MRPPAEIRTLDQIDADLAAIEARAIELLAERRAWARREYEAGHEKTEAIARDLGISPDKLHRWARADGWTRRGRDFRPQRKPEGREAAVVLGALKMRDTTAARPAEQRRAGP